MLYPLFVNLQEKRCVVIGGGAVAERRVVSLLRCGAIVVVTAPAVTKNIESLGSAGSVIIVREPYAERHLDGAFLVVAATNQPEVNKTVAVDAGKINVLVNSADDPWLGNSLTAASIERGKLQIAVTTSGASPTLTSILRSQLDKQFGSEWETWTDLFAALRPDIQQFTSDKERKAVALQVLNSDDIATFVAVGDLENAEEAAKKCILSHLD